MSKLFGGDNFNFADRKQLAEDGTKFCIETASRRVQTDGKERWYCTIFVQKESELAVQTLTFDRSPYRDRGFQGMLDGNKFPAHSCWLENRPFKSKSTGMMQNFYDINFDEGVATCPCGDLNKPEEPKPDLPF